MKDDNIEQDKLPDISPDLLDDDSNDEDSSKNKTADIQLDADNTDIDTETDNDVDNTDSSEEKVFDPFTFEEGWVFGFEYENWKDWIIDQSEESIQKLSEQIDIDFSNFSQYGLAAGIFRNVDSDIQFIVYTNLEEKAFNMAMYQSEGTIMDEDIDRLEKSETFHKFLLKIYNTIKSIKPLIPPVKTMMQASQLSIDNKNTLLIDNVCAALNNKELFKNLMAGKITHN